MFIRQGRFNKKMLSSLHYGKCRIQFFRNSSCPTDLNTKIIGLNYHPGVCEGPYDVHAYTCMLVKVDYLLLLLLLLLLLS